MSQSLAQNYIHIVFSTKHRQPLIYPPFEAELYKYIAGVCNGLGCQTIKVGGFRDHVHILCKLSRKIALMTLVMEVKAESSVWFKTLDDDLAGFYWQNGYAAFSVSPSQAERVAKYIDAQEAHHSHWSFQDEYRDFLSKHQQPYDECFIWD